MNSNHSLRWKIGWLCSLGVHFAVLLGLCLFLLFHPQNETIKKYSVKIGGKNGEGKAFCGNNHPSAAGANQDLQGSLTPLVQHHNSAEALNQKASTVKDKIQKTAPFSKEKGKFIQTVDDLFRSSSQSSLGGRQNETGKQSGLSKGSENGEGLGPANGIGEGNGEGYQGDSGASTGTGGGNEMGAGFEKGIDGTYTALSARGIDYTIIFAPEPEYPREAKKRNLSEQVTVEARFTVGLNGQVEQVQVVNGIPDLGFQEAAEAALYQWRFKPIYYQGVNIKCKFSKRFIFHR